MWKRNMKSFSSKTLNFFFRKFWAFYILDLAKTVWALRILWQKSTRNFGIKHSSNRLECKPQFLLPHHQAKDWTKNKRHGYTRLFFQFLLIWYDRARPLISRKYNFILWTSFFYEIFGFITWKIKTTSHKI